jgi:hypothetical protein
MKNYLILLTIVILSINSYGQNNDGKKVQLEFKQRVSFYSVNDRYELIKDTIYHANNGFIVFSGHDSNITKDGKEYVIFTYPDWKGDIQEMDEIDNKQGQKLIDSLFLKSVRNLYPNDSTKVKVYKEIIDSLIVLAKVELEKKPVHVNIYKRNGLKLAMLKTEFEKITDTEMVEDVYSLKWKHSTKLASGFMSIPFKLRPKQDSINFNITTDVTLGAYIGIKKRISRKGNNYIVLPATLGLSYINVGNNETSNVNTENNSSIVPGITWSSGIVFDLNGFNLGLVFGQDFASGVGDDWLYHKKFWYSFSIGYSFLNNKDK